MCPINSAINYVLYSVNLFVIMTHRTIEFSGLRAPVACGTCWRISFEPQGLSEESAISPSSDWNITGAEISRQSFTHHSFVLLMLSLKWLSFHKNQRKNRMNNLWQSYQAYCTPRGCSGQSIHQLFSHQRAFGADNFPSWIGSRSKEKWC